MNTVIPSLLLLSLALSPPLSSLHKMYPLPSARMVVSHRILPGEETQTFILEKYKLLMCLLIFVVLGNFLP